MNAFHPGSPSRFSVVSVLFFATAVFVAASSMARADVADLTREVDLVRTALNKAVADAEAGRLRPLRDSLKNAQDSWSRFYVGYRAWGSGTDPAWVTDIDAIQAEFMNATNAVSPGNNAPLAAAALQRIQTMLTGLLERNDVPDVDKAAAELNASLAEVQDSMKALEGKALGPDTLATLSTQWTSISESWASFTNVLIEGNTLRLSDRELANLKQRVDRQSVLLESVGKALGNANLSSGLTSLSSAVEGLRALTSQWSVAPEEPATTTAQPKPLDSRRRRGLNLR